MQPIPCCLVATAQLALELLGTQARRGGGDEIDRPEPLPNGPVGSLQHRASGRRYFKTTTTALLQPAARSPPEFPALAARADHPVGPARLDQIFVTIIFVGKALSK